ncbi:LuxR C-terminal-related transcriptional regulator [Kitasatospora sp. MAA4]|uniref:LuxR C-terminal-related transcriptional regulator n=1 Tax=Kitasatospora sp. MAA4 TaxID=3035093 RepID=UPI0024767044|nr:LuxR C-terminal-related transcriptional regulator [Kitasatospora sp. MAA4]
MDQPEPGSPALPGERARELYLAVLGEGGRLRMADVRPEDAARVAELLELGLLVALPAEAAYATVNPRAVGSRLSEELRSAGTRLLVQAQEVPALLEDLTRAYDLTPRKLDRSGEVRHVHRAEEIRRLVLQLGSACTSEVLAAQPSGGPLLVLGATPERTRAFLEDGGCLRVLYEPAARADGPTADYVAAVAEAGARFRVLGESFKRMFIFDRTTVVIPAVGDTGSAAFIDDPAVVAFLLGMFERDWQRAEPAQWSAVELDKAGLPVHAQVGRMLSQGLTQRAIAGRLGLSERTVAGHISRLRELYDAETLFQLGWLMRAADGDAKSEPSR